MPILEWANAQRDGRPAEYRLRPLFNPSVLVTPTTRVPCSNAAKTRNPLKFAGVPQTPEPISAASGPKFTILSAHVEEVLLFRKSFSDCRYVTWMRRYSPTKLYNGAEMAILRPVFSASRVQLVSDLHPKFPLSPHRVYKCSKHPICDG